jgi:NitT/TauT family transport system permease protein
MTATFRLRKRDVLRMVEIPFATNGLLWNSMLSMAGGWFFLMVIESFTLGDKDFRLPGIGSYMAVAYERHDATAIFAGIAAMFLLIILVDRCVWAPAVAWSERFKWERDTHAPPPKSLVLDFLKRSNLLAVLLRLMDDVRSRFLTAIESRLAERRPVRPVSRRTLMILRGIMMAATLVGVLWGGRSLYSLIAATPTSAWLTQILHTFYSLIRVTFAVGLGSLWAVPAGVFIGMNPKWTRRLQPVVQVVASFPAPMLFPVITFLLVRAGVSLELGSVVLLLFASQWYILFNVIAGATLIPYQMRELAAVFHVKGWHLWKSVILPAIFPSLVNGWITAAGGAWNASIVSEYVQRGDTTLTATVIGADISLAAAQANFPRLASGVLIMVTTVVLLNRFFWGSLYRLAETRFKMD